MKLFELISADKRFTSQRVEILNTVSDTFNISAEEHQQIQGFFEFSSNASLDMDNLLIARKNPENKFEHTHEINISMNGLLVFLRIKSVEMYFVRYLGNEEILLNGFTIKPALNYQFSPGSTIKTPANSKVILDSHFRKIHMAFLSKT